MGGKCLSSLSFVFCVSRQTKSPVTKWEEDLFRGHGHSQNQEEMTNPFKRREAGSLVAFKSSIITVLSEDKGAKKGESSLLLKRLS